MATILIYYAKEKQYSRLLTIKNKSGYLDSAVLLPHKYLFKRFKIPIPYYLDKIDLKV